MEFAEFVKILTDRMDPLIPKFAAISPAFVSEYKNARNIVDAISNPAVAHRAHAAAGIKPWA